MINHVNVVICPIFHKQFTKLKVFKSNFLNEEAIEKKIEHIYKDVVRIVKMFRALIQKQHVLPNKSHKTNTILKF